MGEKKREKGKSVDNNLQKMLNYCTAKIMERDK